MSMCIRRRVPAVAVTLLTLAYVPPALAQKVTEIPDLTARQVLVQLAHPSTAVPVGDAVALTSALEIGTAPFGTSSGGFVFKLDPSSGLLARTTTTFGPSFTERALTSGEGQVSVGVTFSSASYDKLGDFSLSSLPVGTATGTSPVLAGTSTADVNLRVNTVAMSGTLGVTENFDIGVVVPLLSVKLDATSSLINGSGTVARLAETDTVFSGIGDVAAIAKYRVVRFGGADLPDPGGIALLVNMRLPTGDRDNLRGLGVTRTLAGVIVSFGRGRLRPHATAGFEAWSKGVDVAGAPGQRVSVRHMVQYAAGVEIEAAPKLTLLLDFLGNQIRGGGQVGLGAATPVANQPGITSTQSLVALGDAVQRALLVPGMKVNLKGKMLLSLNAIITLKNNGLHATVTPVAGINLTM